MEQKGSLMCSQKVITDPRLEAHNQLLGFLELLSANSYQQHRQAVRQRSCKVFPSSRHFSLSSE